MVNVESKSIQTILKQGNWCTKNKIKAVYSIDSALFWRKIMILLCQQIYIPNNGYVWSAAEQPIWSSSPLCSSTSHCAHTLEVLTHRGCSITAFLESAAERQHQQTLAPEWFAHEVSIWLISCILFRYMYWISSRNTNPNSSAGQVGIWEFCVRALNILTYVTFGWVLHHFC